ncbi:DUF2125 domain-containing protein [Dongia rigui]|uniref:DUF2125 domain-containing protein n=1 Tax=Dongia rigui TaxID=940149 RepID=A0ABU5DVF4_9PROT|nr:DUF2125 domain-containing protein [Dongia rigui]MDY0871269.1 DUF2125 domain-containing protein [Dongia rigui]
MKLPAYLGLGLVLILGGAYTGYWFFVAAKLQAGIEAWVAEQRAAGIGLTFADGSISGYPFAFRRNFGAARIDIPGASPVSLATGSLVAEMRPWNINQVTFAANALDLTLGADSYRAAEAQGSVDIPKAPPADYHQPFLGFAVSMGDLALPAGKRAVTAGPIERLTVQGAIMGPVPVAPDLGQALSGWASAGGVLEVKAFAFSQAPLQATGDGTLALDEALQPLGALSLHAYGVAETVELLAQDGLLDARSAKTAKIMAQGLAKTDDSGRLRVDLSLSLQQGYLWLGPLKLARLPALRW